MLRVLAILVLLPTIQIKTLLCEMLNICKSTDKSNSITLFILTACLTVSIIFYYNAVIVLLCEPWHHYYGCVVDYKCLVLSFEFLEFQLDRQFEFTFSSFS